LPTTISWKELDARFRQHRLVTGGSYGPLSGKVFHLGHTGSQADPELVGRAIEVIKTVVKQ
jgi:aspartate aminotransferase-like enzyme